MEQIGFVKRIIGNDIELEVRRVSACGGGGCSSCSSSCEVAPHNIVLPNKLNAKVGDFVEVKGEVKNILKYAFIVYMIPFASIILGIVLGNLYFKSKGYSAYEIYSFLSGIVFLIISYFIIKLIDRKISKKDETVISIVRIL